MSTILNKTNRGPGTLISSNMPVPTGLVNREFIVTGLLSAADQIDPTLTVGLAIEGAYEDPPLNWKPLISSTWQGNGRDRNGNPTVPFLDYTTGNALPLYARGVMDLNKTVSIGLDGTIT